MVIEIHIFIGDFQEKFFLYTLLILGFDWI